VSHLTAGAAVLLLAAVVPAQVQPCRSAQLLLHSLLVQARVQVPATRRPFCWAGMTDCRFLSDDRSRHRGSAGNFRAAAPCAACYMAGHCPHINQSSGVTTLELLMLQPDFRLSLSNVVATS